MLRYMLRTSMGFSRQKYWRELPQPTPGEVTRVHRSKQKGFNDNHDGYLVLGYRWL